MKIFFAMLAASILSAITMALVLIIHFAPYALIAWALIMAAQIIAGVTHA